jgi:hypothetical protein
MRPKAEALGYLEAQLLLELVGLVGDSRGMLLMMMPR